MQVMTSTEYLKQQIDKLIADFEERRFSFLRGITSATLTIAVGGKKYRVRYSAKAGNVRIDRKDLCNILFAFSRLKEPDKGFRVWNERLVNTQRKNCFWQSDVVDARCSTENSLLTAFGAALLLRHQSRRYPELASSIRNVFIANGLFSPFAELPVATKAQETLDQILAQVRRMFPQLLFAKQKYIVSRLQTKKRRYLDLWCEQLKLNIECDEYRHVDYDENYAAVRRRDIESVYPGSVINVYHYNPQSCCFDIDFESARICDLIEHLVELSSLPGNTHNRSLHEIECSEKSTAGVFPWLVAQEASNSGEHLNAAEVTIETLLAHKEKVDIHIAAFEEARKSSLRILKRKDGVLRVCIDGTEYGISYKVDSSRIEGTVAFNRQTLCQAIIMNTQKAKAYWWAFKQWRNGLTPKDFDRYFCKLELPTFLISKQKSIDAETMWLSKCGLESLLSYYASTRPNAVKAIRKALETAGLMSPFEFLPINVAPKAKTLTRILSLIGKRQPEFTFIRTSLTFDNEQAPQRFLDAWCPELKLNVQCRTSESYYISRLQSEKYYCARERDIRTVLGQSTQFCYFNPLSNDFSEETVAGEISQVISEILQRQSTGDKLQL